MFAMRNPVCHFLLSSLVCLSIFLPVDGAIGAEVSIAVSSQETYVGQPITLQIRVDDASSRSEPEIPDVDGLTIESAGPPAVNSQVTLYNDGRSTRRSTRSTVTYSYEVTPQREGSFTIPPIKVQAGALSKITEAVRLVVTESETGDLMFVEISGEKDETYVGQSLELTLRIWIRPYKDAKNEISLSEGQMWGLFSDRTNWGQFAKTLEDLAGRRKRPSGRRVLREDSEGQQREYFLYEIPATVYPTRPGRIEADDVRIVIQYPTAIGRRRDPLASLFEDARFPFGGSMMDDSFFGGFGSQLAVTSARPLVGEAVVAPIDVKSIPTQGRPDDYMGAVGRYAISAEATPKSVKVGDPITLQINVDGTGPMDLVLPPRLASQPDLTRDFKVPDEDLAGFVAGQQKIFQTTIRPKHESASAIPSISFSYFDPQLEQFVTVATDPIEIDVEVADVLKLDSIVADRSADFRSEASNLLDSKVPWQLNTSPHATLSLFPVDQLAASAQRAEFLSLSTKLALSVPPILFLIGVLFCSRGRMGSLTTSRRRFEKAISASDALDEIVSALETWLAGSFGIQDRNNLRHHLAGRLRQSGQSDLAIRFERMCAAVRSQELPLVETGKSQGLSLDSIESARREARQIVESVQSKSKSTYRAGQMTKVPASLVLAFLMVGLSAVEASADDTDISADQRATILREASGLYHVAIENENAAEAKVQFAEAAAKYQIASDAEPGNDRLFFNLGNARLQAGKRDLAIAAYRKALRINPDNSVYYENLVVAQSTVQRDGKWKRINDLLLRVVHPRKIRAIGLTAWAVFWGMLLLSSFARTSTTKTSMMRMTATLALAISVTASGSYLSRRYSLTRDNMAVLVGTEMVVRSGDGEEFPAVTAISSGDGELVSVQDQRGGWTRIRRGDGTVGWIRNTNAEPI